MYRNVIHILVGRDKTTLVSTVFAIKSDNIICLKTPVPKNLFALVEI